MPNGSIHCGLIQFNPAQSNFISINPQLQINLNSVYWKQAGLMKLSALNSLLIIRHLPQFAIRSSIIQSSQSISIQSSLISINSVSFTLSWLHSISSIQLQSSFSWLIHGWLSYTLYFLAEGSIKLIYSSRYLNCGNKSNLSYFQKSAIKLKCQK